MYYHISLFSHVLFHTLPLCFVVNNAGVGMIGPLECQNVSAMQELFNTNFFGLVRLVKELLPDMKRRQSGHIVVMSSVLGIQGNTT